MVYVTRREGFNAAHKLYRADWSDAKNMEIFGACANPNWHGHNYVLFVTVKGKADPETGFVIDLKNENKNTRKGVIRLVIVVIALHCLLLTTYLATTQQR